MEHMRLVLLLHKEHVIMDECLLELLRFLSLPRLFPVVRCFHFRYVFEHCVRAWDVHFVVVVDVVA